MALRPLHGKAAFLAFCCCWHMSEKWLHTALLFNLQLTLWWKPKGFVEQHKPSKWCCSDKSLTVITDALVLQYLQPIDNYSERQYVTSQSWWCCPEINWCISPWTYLQGERKKKSWPWMFPAHIILASNSLRALLYLLTDQKQYIWSDHYSGSTQVSVYQPPHIPAHRQGCFHVPLSHNTVRKESELPLGGSACLPSATSLNNKTGSHRWHLYLKLQRKKYLQY